jgi:hypothetical protein
VKQKDDEGAQSRQAGRRAATDGKPQTGASSDGDGDVEGEGEGEGDSQNDRPRALRDERYMEDQVWRRF